MISTSPAISSLVDWVPMHFMWSLQWMWLVIIFVSSRHIGQKLASGLMTWKRGEKHRVSAPECEQVFFNKPLITGSDKKHSQKEVRFYALGQTDAGRPLFVVFTVRENLIRVISARDMNKKERKVYSQSWKKVFQNLSRKTTSGNSGQTLIQPNISIGIRPKKRYCQILSLPQKKSHCVSPNWWSKSWSCWQINTTSPISH